MANRLFDGVGQLGEQRNHRNLEMPILAQANQPNNEEFADNSEDEEMQDVYEEENHLFDVLNEEISLKNVLKAVVSVNSEKREKVIIFIAENLNYLMFENDWFAQWEIGWS